MYVYVCVYVSVYANVYVSVSIQKVTGWEMIRMEVGNEMEIFITLNIFTNLSAQAGYDTRSIFKQSLTGLNSEFSFS